MKNLNQVIRHYTQAVQQGDLPAAYAGLLAFIGKLRADFIKTCPDYDVGSIYQGYMDMSYFSVSTISLKEKGLKLAVVYLHDQGRFEVWLSARNRAILKKISPVVSDMISSNDDLFHDAANPDAVVERIVSAEPDFEDAAALIGTIKQGVEDFIAVLGSYL